MKISIKLMLNIFVFICFILVSCNDEVVTPPTTNNNKDTTTIKKPTFVGKSYYVSSLIGSDTNNGLSALAPCKNILTAANLTVPGDTVFIMNGVYEPGVLKIEKSGTADKYITYKAFPGHTPKIISGKASIWVLLMVKANYIVVDGIEFEGNNMNLTHEAALAAYEHKNAGGNDTYLYGFYNTNGITMDGKSGAFPIHHVTIRNCKIHDFSGGGISTMYSDYITIEDNVVYNNCWFTMYACSGISTVHQVNVDNSTGYKMFVRRNKCNNNYTKIPWINITPHRLSDGNGIIIDLNQVTMVNGVAVPYTGRTLVENNVSFNNGGSGVHTLGSHVDIVNNTAYNNGVVMGYAEIYAGWASDVRILNNIMYSKTGGKCNSNTSNTNVTYDYNIYFNGSYAVKSPHDKYMDPQFINASTDPLVANFKVANTSPAVNAGYNGFAPKFDILGVARPMGGTVDCGAYELY